MLAIDFGNSRFKWVLFLADKVVGHNAVSYGSESLESLLDAENLPLLENKIMISCVAGESLKERLVKYFKVNGCEDVFFAATQLTQCQVCNSYDVVENMGVDRWLAMIAGYHHELRKPGESVCVIDCGTATTVDFVGCDGKHLGGLIMPGYQTMYKSLMDKASNIQGSIKATKINEIELLPNVSSAKNLGKSTRDCVEQGCAQLMVEGVSGIIDQQSKEVDGKLFCIVTGGDGQWLSELLQENYLFEPFLVHQGLRLISAEL